MDSLVIGAGGFVGGYLLRQLLEEGRDPGATKLPHERIAIDGVEVFDLDLGDQNAIRRLLAAHRPAQIYHLAAQSSVAVSWKQPELTARSFVDCPFLPGQKMYRTGDLARYNEDGQLEYLGRIDNQVKLRGFRIEMGEIETRASQFDGIAQVAAAVKKDQLVLYYTSAGNAPIDAEQLRRFLSETLTEYMVPTVYMPLAAMPMTPNGKIDRKHYKAP